MLIAIRVPAGNERGPLYIEHVLDALHARTHFWRSVRLEIGKHADEVLLYCRFHAFLKETVQRELHAAFPDAELIQLPDDALRPASRARVHRKFLRLHPALASLRTWRNHIDNEQRLFADPLAGVLNLMNNQHGRARVILAVRPIAHWLLARTHRRAFHAVAAASKCSRNLFAVSLCIEVTASTEHRKSAREALRNIQATFARFTTGAAGFRKSFLPLPSYLSTEELASLWHLATQQVRTEKLATVSSRRLEPPVDIPTREREEGITALGRIAFRSRTEICGLRQQDRFGHLYVIGKSGFGKTTLLQNMARSDIENGEGVLYIDPHGDSAEALASAIPPWRTNQTIYFDPADRSHPIGINLLDCKNPEQRAKAASEIVSILQHLYGLEPSNAPRLLDITRNAILALMEVEGTTLLSLVRMLGDRTFRQTIVRQVQDPIVRSYWEQEFGQWKVAEQTQAVASVQNKIRPFVMDHTLRSILGQERNRLDLRTIMDEGKILIVNLSKGKLGEDNAALIGSLIAAKMQLAAMSRADIPEHKRRPFYAYVDEFQNVATQSFAAALSEVRKMGVALTLSHQYISQLEERNREIGSAVRGAIFGNVSNIVAFRVGASDADVLTEELGGELTQQDLTGLPKFNAYARMLINDVPSRPFSIETLKPQEQKITNRLVVVRRVTRRQYARPEAKVQREIEQMLV